jgi:hypothetical protein
MLSKAILAGDIQGHSQLQLILADGDISFSQGEKVEAK